MSQRKPKTHASKLKEFDDTHKLKVSVSADNVNNPKVSKKSSPRHQSTYTDIEKVKDDKEKKKSSSNIEKDKMDTEAKRSNLKKTATKSETNFPISPKKSIESSPLTKTSSSGDKDKTPKSPKEKRSTEKGHEKADKKKEKIKRMVLVKIKIQKKKSKRKAKRKAMKKQENQVQIK